MTRSAVAACALAKTIEIGDEQVIVMNFSERSDKNVHTVAEMLLG